MGALAGLAAACEPELAGQLEAAYLRQAQPRRGVAAVSHERGQAPRSGSQLPGPRAPCECRLVTKVLVKVLNAPSWSSGCVRLLER